MDPILITVVVTTSVVAVIAAAVAVTVVRYTVKGTDSQHRAAVLSAAAEVVRAVRGRR